MSDYISSLRKLIGHETLLTVGIGCLIEDEYGRLLLQKRKDNNLWGIPGGLMEIGETYLETVNREVLEETSLRIEKPSLFGIYSGDACFADYPNGDMVYSIQIVFHTVKFEGNLQQEGDESFEHRFLSRSEIETIVLNSCQAPFVSDWVKGLNGVIVR